MTRNYSISDALIIFFLALKIREKIAKFDSSAPRQKFKNLVHRIFSKEFLSPMNQVFLSFTKTQGGDVKITFRQTCI